MPPVKNTVTIDTSKPVSPTSGGATKRGNVLICDFNLTAIPNEMEWKPFMDLNVEAALLEGDEGRAILFLRRRVIPSV